MLQSLVQGVRLVLRRVPRQPGFTAVAVGTLALAIGANTATFSIVHSLLLAPLAWPEPDRLVSLTDVQGQFGRTRVSFPEYRDWREGLGDAVDVAAWFSSTYNLIGGGEPEALTATRVSANLLNVLGARPALGRWFTPEEEQASATPVAVLGHALWHRRFGGDPTLVGRTINLDDRLHTVVGILPPGLKSVLPAEAPSGRERDLWVPLRLEEARAPRGLHFLRVAGRLQPGVSVLQARARLDALTARLQGEGVTPHGAELLPLTEEVSGDLRPTVLALFGAVLFVHLIACTNLANLLLMRVAGRRHDTAVRLALGAGRGRLVGQFLAESLTLALLGGALGLLLARGALAMLTTNESVAALGAPASRLNVPVLGFSLALSLATGILCGLVPALQASRPDFQEDLKAGTREGGGRSRGREALIVVEAALSLILLVGAGLLVRSFVRTLAVPPGFQAAGLLCADVAIPPRRYPDPSDQMRFFERVLEGLRRAPGVQGAALVNELPLGGGDVSGDFTIEGKTFPAEKGPIAAKRIVSPDYFRVMGIPVRHGRVFEERDRAGFPGVAVISGSLAARYFPGEDPIGRRVDFSWDTTGQQEIVGVVGDVRHERLDRSPEPTLYVPYLQRPDSSFTLVVQSGSPETAVAALRRETAAVDKDQPVARARMFDQIVGSSLAGRRLSTGLATGFAAAALLLAALGIYGVFSYAVRQQTREIGVRMALGARAADIRRLVLGRVLGLTAAGALLGTAGALALGRILAQHLFGVSPSDPTTFASVTALLFGVSTVAAFLPARRAMRVDPVTALRHE